MSRPSQTSSPTPSSGDGALEWAGAGIHVETNNAAALRRRFVDLDATPASASATTASATAPSLRSLSFLSPTDLAFVEETRAHGSFVPHATTNASSDPPALSDLQMHMQQLSTPSPAMSAQMLLSTPPFQQDTPLAFKPGSIFYNETLVSASVPEPRIRPAEQPSLAETPFRNTLFETRQTISKPASKMTPEELAALRSGRAIPPPSPQLLPQNEPSGSPAPVAGAADPLQKNPQATQPFVAPAPGLPPQPAVPISPSRTSPSLETPISKTSTAASAQDDDEDFRSITVPVRRRPNLPPQQAGRLAVSEPNPQTALDALRSRPPLAARFATSQSPSSTSFTPNPTALEHVAQQPTGSNADRPAETGDIKELLQHEQMLHFQHQQPTDPNFRISESDRHHASLARFPSTTQTHRMPSLKDLSRDDGSVTSRTAGSEPIHIPASSESMSPVTYPSASPPYVDTAFLRSVNTSSRRGFVDLDEIDNPSSIVPLSLHGNRSRTNASSYSSSIAGPLSSLTRDPNSRPILQSSFSQQHTMTSSPSSALSSLLLSKSNDISSQDSPSKSRKDPSQINPSDRRITHPGVWDRINLSFLPTNKNYLGEGRYAQVYLGYYVIMHDSASPHVPVGSSPNIDATMAVAASDSATGDDLPTPSHALEDLRPCAVKRMYPTAEAQSIGLAESYLLRRISRAHSNIITLIGIKDENDLDAPAVKSKLALNLDTPGGPAASATSVSGRRTPGLGGSSGSASRSVAGTPGSATTPPTSRMPDPNPRLLLMLEYLPNGNMWDWTMRHRTSVGLALWLKWARELVGAIGAIHAFGIIHHDIKPHNILLSEFLDVRLADFGNACFVPEMDPLEAAALIDAPPAVSEHLLGGRLAYLSAVDRDVVMEDAMPTSHASAPVVATTGIPTNRQDMTDSPNVLTSAGTNISPNVSNMPANAQTSQPPSLRYDGPPHVLPNMNSESASPWPLQRMQQESETMPQIRPSPTVAAVSTSSSFRPPSLYVPDAASPVLSHYDAPLKLARTPSQSTSHSNVSAYTPSLNVGAVATPASIFSAASSARQHIVPGSPASPHSQSLTNGLGRGTLAYSAPDLLDSSKPYSFPVDMYAIGVTLYALISGKEPFGLARSSVHMIVGIQRGFFESGLQHHGRILPSSLSGSAAVAAVAAAAAASPSNGGVIGGIIGDPVDGNWRFQSGETVPSVLVDLVKGLVHRDPAERPSAAQTADILDRVYAAL